MTKRPLLARSRPAFVGLFLVLLLAVIGLAEAQPSSRPDFPQGEFALRVYYDKLEDIQALQSYDLWSVNNLQEQYVLIGATSDIAMELQKQGWRVAVDHQASGELRRSRSTDLFQEGYRTVDELVASLNEMATNYPLLTALVDYGDSYCKKNGGCVTPGGESLSGYDLLALRITNEQIPGASVLSPDSITRGEKPVFVLVANVHAREITTPELALRMADLLLKEYGQDADVTWLVDWHEIWIVPTANPDGHWLVELGEQPPYNGAFYQRKNLNRDPDDDGQPDCIQWPPLPSWQYGVDLNRNHSFAWGEPGSSPEPCSALFRGPAPASEPETHYLEKLVRDLIPDQRGEALTDPAPVTTTGLLISLHSYGNLVLWPWGFTFEDGVPLVAPNRSDLKAIGDRLAAFNRYRSCQPTECLYGANGATDDWAYGELGIPAFTFEIGYQFMPPYNQVDEEQWPANGPALLHAAKLARMPYQTIRGPEVTDIKMIDAGNGLVEVTATVSDDLTGGDQLASARLSVAWPSWSEAAETVVMEATDGLFDSSVEEVTVVIQLESQRTEKPIVFIEGQDTLGYWGLTAASFVDIVPASPAFDLFVPISLAD